MNLNLHTQGVFCKPVHGYTKELVRGGESQSLHMIDWFRLCSLTKATGDSYIHESWRTLYYSSSEKGEITSSWGAQERPEEGRWYMSQSPTVRHNLLVGHQNLLSASFIHVDRLYCLTSFTVMCECVTNLFPVEYDDKWHVPIPCLDLKKE